MLPGIYVEMIHTQVIQNFSLCVLEGYGCFCDYDAVIVINNAATLKINKNVK